MKKLWALLLAIAMVAALAVPALADTGTTTIYFDIGDTDFGTVYCYAYKVISSDDVDCNYEWPGVEMTHVAGSIYSTELSSSWDAILFNNGNGLQTGDISLPTDGKNLYSYADDTWSIYGAATALESSPATGKGEGDYAIGVTGTYAPGAPAGDIISADIAWEAMSFTYAEGSVGIWNPEIHDYAGGRPGGWSSNRPAITVTNHSNVGIDATFAFAAASGVTATGTFFTKGAGGFYTAITSAARQKIALGSAVGTTVAEAPKGSLYFGITGGSISESKTLGTITVTIAKEQWTEVGTGSALQAAISDGGRVKLTADINAGTNMGQSLLGLAENIILDLNGHTLSGTSMAGIVAIGAGEHTFKNGTITNTTEAQAKAVWNVSSDVMLHLDACTLSVGNYISGYALLNSGGTIVANDCSFTGQLGGSGRVELSGTITLNGSIADTLTVVAKAGTYNFDPTAYVDAANYTVTANADGTWTVAAKTVE